jgi:adenylate kinase
MAEDACRKRYRVFMEQTYAVLQSLKQHFHFHVINAQGDLASVERAIISEFQYQSSLELDEETFDAIHLIPLASEIVIAARQHLVERLEGYQRDQSVLFHRVISVIERDFVPVIVLHAITGLAKITSDNELFADPVAMAMLVDVLNERGYRTTATVEMREVPTRVDPATHVILCTRKPRYRFELRFQGSQIRRGV